MEEDCRDPREIQDYLVLPAHPDARASLDSQERMAQLVQKVVADCPVNLGRREGMDKKATQDRQDLMVFRDKTDKMADPAQPDRKESLDSQAFQGEDCLDRKVAMGLQVKLEEMD